MRRLAATILLLAACSEATAPDPGVPQIEYAAVDAVAGTNGLTAVGWSHPRGPDALVEGSASTWIMTRRANGDLESTERFADHMGAGVASRN